MEQIVIRVSNDAERDQAEKYLQGLGYLNTDKNWNSVWKPMSDCVYGFCNGAYDFHSHGCKIDEKYKEIKISEIMNKQEATKRLDAIEREAAELRKIIEQPEGFTIDGVQIFKDKTGMNIAYKTGLLYSIRGGFAVIRRGDEYTKPFKVVPIEGELKAGRVYSEVAEPTDVMHLNLYDGENLWYWNNSGCVYKTSNKISKRKMTHEILPLKHEIPPLK